MKRIVVSTEVRESLRRAFGVSDKTISLALNYRRDTDLSRKIRTLAIRKGGKIYDAEEMATIHDSGTKMIQTWGDRIRLEADKSTGVVVWYVDGKKRGERSDVSIADLLVLQHRLGLIYGRLA